MNLTDKLPVLNAGTKNAINFVFLAASEHLRELEHEFSDGILNELSSYEGFKTIRRASPEMINFTYWINRPADIIMSHGVADKNYLTKRKNGVYLLNKYKKVCVPGKWLKEKIIRTKGIDIDPDNIHIVGWPRLDNLINLNNEYKNRNPNSLGEKTRVLWAPTHGGRENASSFPVFEKYRAQLSELFDYDSSLHPSSRSSGVPAKPTLEKLIEADVIIADQGTILYEALALGKCVICPSWLVSEGIVDELKGSAEAYIYMNKLGNHAESFDDLVSMIKMRPKINEKTKNFIESYIDPDAIGNSYRLIASVVDDLDKKITDIKSRL